MSTEKIVEKIAKLLNVSKDRGATDAEAMSALAMAQQLMAKYGVAASDLEEVERDESNIVSLKCEHKWDAGYRQNLACVISENYRCKVYLNGGTIVFMGVEEDALIAKQAFEFAYRFIYRRGNQEYEKAKKESLFGSARGVFNSYALGFIKGLDEVLSAQSKALMIVVPDTVVEAFDQMNLKDGRGGMNMGDGYYRKYYEMGFDEAKEQYGRKAIGAGV